eukprot:906-Eustigmatos_ZCMA.PRE.1
MNRLVLGVLPCVLAACGTPSSVTPSASGAGAGEVPALAYAPVLTKLESPWDMAFLPDGTMFFTEKCHG